MSRKKIGAFIGAGLVGLIALAAIAGQNFQSSPTATTKAQPAATAKPTALPTVAPTPVSTIAPTRAPTAAPTAVPTSAPTVDPSSGQFMAYNVVFQADVKPFVADTTAMGPACSNMDFAGCRAGAVAVGGDSKKMLTDLRPMSIPSCIKQSDGLLRQALGNYISATDLVVRGIDASDGTQITDGATQMTAANDLITQATAAMPHSC